MGFSLKKVVPWGRSFDEYCAMFTLSELDLKNQLWVSVMARLPLMLY